VEQANKLEKRRKGRQYEENQSDSCHAPRPPFVHHPFVMLSLAMIECPDSHTLKVHTPKALGENVDQNKYY